MHFRSALAAAFLLAPATVRAQSPTPPASPGPTVYLGSDLVSIYDSYTFSGCAEGVVSIGPGGSTVGTPYCLGGRFTRGLRSTGALFNVLAINVTQDPRIRSLDPGTFNFRLVYGTETSPRCPSGCETGVTVSFIRVAPPGAAYLITEETLLPHEAFAPERVRMLWDYNAPGGYIGGAFIELAFTPTAVPEPATVTLVAFGLLGVGAAASRRRRA